MSRLCCISLCVALALPGCRAEVPTEPESAPQVAVAPVPPTPMRWLDAHEARRVRTLVLSLATATPASCRDLGLVDHDPGDSRYQARLSCTTGAASGAMPDVQVRVGAPTSRSVDASIQLPRGRCIRGSVFRLELISAGDWQILPGPMQQPDGDTRQWIAGYHHAGLRAWINATGPRFGGDHCQARFSIRREPGPGDRPTVAGSPAS